jgi:serine/threonine protein kinase
MSTSQDDDVTIISRTTAGEQSFARLQTRSCPKCGLVVTDKTMVCPVDGTAIFEAPGKILADSYDFMSVTGWGGMSVIYKARQRGTGLVVAIKMLHSLLMTDQSLRRFQQEAKAIMSLRHPNIITVHDFGVSEHGQPYMVMDFIEGKTLADVIKDKGTLSLEESLHRFIQLTDALDHAHQVGVLHRDLKPSNIMISNKDGNFEDARIVDFGIAKLLDKEGDSDDGHLTQTGELFGSPLYMSPEQCRGSQVDARTDIYSMGCVMYETLTGQPPFKGATIVDTLMLQMSAPAKSLAEACPERRFPHQLENVIAKALQKDPSDRYPTMKHMELALMEIQPNQKLSGAPIWRNRQKKLATIPVFVYCTGVAFLMLTIGAALWWKWTYAPPVWNSNSTKNEVLKPSLTGDNNSVANITDSGRVKIADSIVTLLTAPRGKITAATLQKCLNTDLGLTELNLKDAHIGDTGTEYFTNQRSLKSLLLDETNVGDLTLSRLTSLPNMEKLSLRETKITDRGLGFLLNLQNMTAIYLSETQVTDQGMHRIAQFSKLKELSASSTGITDAGLESLRRLSLTKLHASDTKIGDLGAASLSDMVSLEELHLRHTKVGDKGIAQLKKLQNLKELNVAETSVTDKGMQYLSQFPNLNSFCIAENPITDAGTTVFQKMLKLERLDLESTKITDKTILNLVELPHLKELNVKDDNIGDAGLVALSHMPHLAVLNLAGTNVTDKGLKKFQSGKALTTLILTDCDELSLSAIREFKKQTPNLSVYVMSDARTY